MYIRCNLVVVVLCWAVCISMSCWVCGLILLSSRSMLAAQTVKLDKKFEISVAKSSQRSKVRL